MDGQEATADEWDGSPDVASGRDLVRAALASAQRMAHNQPRPGRDAQRRARTRAANLRRGGYSGAHPDERDPRPAGEIMAALFAERGWQQPLAEARVFADWESLVGAELAARCAPVSLTDGELRVAAESTAWATQLRLLTGSLLARLAAELGPTVVSRLHVTGPVAPSWRFGPRAVHGARGQRDTYG